MKKLLKAASAGMFAFLNKHFLMLSAMGWLIYGDVTMFVLSVTMVFYIRADVMVDILMAEKEPTNVGNLTLNIQQIKPLVPTHEEHF